MIDQSHCTKNAKIVRKWDLIGWGSIILGSILLGIWSIKGTIALRNIILVIGAINTFKCCARYFEENTQNIPLKNLLPHVFLVLMFCWVIFHYLFLSRFPELQLHELESTWFRSFLSMVFGVGVGVVLIRKPGAINYIWSGILISFLCLLYQYFQALEKANGSFINNLDGYIYPGKISGVLMGTILISGVFGSMVDAIRVNGKYSIFILNAILALASFILFLFICIYILDTRNGLAISLGLTVVTCFLIIGKIVRNFLKTESQKKPKVLTFVSALILALVLVVTISWSFQKHMLVNSGWSSTWEDAKIAFQIEKYQHWADPKESLPRNELNNIVTRNTYVRVAWATAGATIFMPQNPYGLGILKEPFTVLMKDYAPKSSTYLPSTHSAWIELGLAFGYPGIILMLSSLFACGFLAVRTRSRFAGTVWLLMIGIFWVYALGEISSQHSIEILFFLISLMATLLFPFSQHLKAT